MICRVHGLALCPGKGISVLSPEQAEEGAVPRMHGGTVWGESWWDDLLWAPARGCSGAARSGPIFYLFRLAPEQGLSL